MRLRIFGPLLACAVLLPFTVSAQGPEPMAYRAAASTQFGNHPALPGCATIAVQDGDPATGRSIIMLKAKAGCVLPWHWHTPNERLIIVSGSARADMKDMKPIMLRAGDFVLLPSKGVHQFNALTEVTLYDISDAPFDMHYVDAGGNEITPEAAFKGAAGTSTAR